MAFLSWRRDYEVGVKLIDAEHRGLFDLINEFHDTRARGNAGKEAAQVLNRLIAYAEEHFQHEEKLMSDNGYRLLDQHRQLHSDLVSSIFAINERLAADTANASAEILPFIKNWLVEHIIQHDMDIGDFMRRKSGQAKNALQQAPEQQVAPKTAKELEQP